MRTGENIRLRKDGRFEARYEKGRDINGKIIYGYCYGLSYEEAEEKRNYILSSSFSEREMNLLILGAGSHGEEVYEIARAIRIFKTISFLDDIKTGDNIIGKWEEVEKLINKYPAAITAVGDKLLRRRAQKKLADLGFIIPVLIHPTAMVSPKSSIGPGSVVCASAILDAGSVIGRGCIISSGATVGRNAILPDWSFMNNGEIIVKKEN